MNEYLNLCERAARTGGRIIQSWIGRFQVSHKGHADLVTEADLASQEAIRQVVLGVFPEHCLLGEEQAAADGLPRAEYRWIVDPLDGTTNFAHGVPHYCVSLALERNGELLVGVVYDPVRDECFSAAAGQGVWLNGQAIRPSNVVNLAEALGTVGFPPAVSPDAPDLLVFNAMLRRCQAIRRTGSSALNLAYLAAGRFDLYWSYSTKIWDVAAGVLLVKEAGGVITSPQGGPFVLEDVHFLAAATPELHRCLLEVATSVVKEHRLE